MKNQNLPIVPIIFLSIIFTAVLFLISLYFQNQQLRDQIKYQSSSLTPLDVADPASSGNGGYPTGATPQVFISPAPKEEKNNVYR